MPRLTNERLNQMIENALSHKQEKRPLRLNYIFRRVKGLNLKTSVCGLTFASLIISYVFIPSIIKSRIIADVNEINEYITFMIIEDL